MSSLTTLRKWMHARLPNALVSRAFGYVSDIEFPAPLQAVINRAYARLVRAAVDECERPPGGYSSLNAFFTRALREGTHIIDATPDSLVSPVDGLLSHAGRIPEDGALFQVKGKRYDLGELLGSAADASRFIGGAHATLYLSPRDYHRIHAPVDGQVTRLRYLPGRLLPVNPFAVTHFEGLFPTNERLISFIEVEGGRQVAVVKVGATCVGRIGVAYDTLITNQARERRTLERRYETPIEIARGEPLGVFNLGSTVVLIVEGQDFSFEPGLDAPAPVRVGRLLGRWR